MTTPPIDITALLAATCDLESGHPVEAVLRGYGIVKSSAFEVVATYQKRLERGATTSEQYARGWQLLAEDIRPCVEAISAYLAENPQL